MDLVLEALRVGLGTLASVVALILIWVTVRSWRHGREAYEANRIITYKSAWKTFAGIMPDDCDGRSKHGLSVDLKSSELSAQRMLSSEAVDDVIGRSF